MKQVRPDTLIKYAEHVDDFLDWVKVAKRRIRSDREADKMMAVYFDPFFEDSASQTTASYTLFGYLTMRSLPDRPERGMFPLGGAALTAWKGTRAGGSCVGMVPQVIFHFAAYCIDSLCSLVTI